MLLQGAASVSRHTLLSGLLMERAAAFFLQANQTRRYVFHVVIAGNRLHKCGLRPARHAAVCFAASMLVLDRGLWGDLKAKLSRALAQDLKFLGCEGAQRSLLLMLKMLAASMTDAQEIGSNIAALTEAVNVFLEVTSGGGAWGSILVREGWQEATTRAILLDPLPISPLPSTRVVTAASAASSEGGADGSGGGSTSGESTSGASTSSYTQVCGLAIPHLDTASAAIVQSLKRQQSRSTPVRCLPQ